jgi:ABC-2 type transport system permease protein
MMYPIDVLTGRVSIGRSVGLIGIQVGWLLATLACGALVTRAGRRTLEVQGG